MWLLLNWRLWVVVAIAAALAASHYTVYRKGKHVVQAEWTASIASANSEARHLEQARQSAADGALRVAAAREAGIRLDADRARGMAGGLRDDLSAVRLHAQESRAASDATVAALSDVLGSCVNAYSDLALEADRATSEAMTLRQAWPK